MITIQIVTSNVQCPPPVYRHLLTRRTVSSKTVFSIARSTFRTYSVMDIFKSSIVWGFFEYTESGAHRQFDHPVLCIQTNTPIGWRPPDKHPNQKWSYSFWLKSSSFFALCGSKVLLQCVEEDKSKFQSRSDVWLTVHRDSVWIRKTN